MELAHKLFTALFPSRCLLCRNTIHLPVMEQEAVDIDICGPCISGLPHNCRYCSRCALPLPVDLPANVMCGRCIQKTPVFDYCQSLFRYEDDVIKLVHQLKFSDRLTCARSIGEMLVKGSERLFSTHGKPDCLLPVPLHSKRLYDRGYNQSIEISRGLARQHTMVIDHVSVIRQRSTATQTGLDARSRLKNIKGAFRLNKEISYDHVLIIDDVVTTSATVNELARLLKKNGVRKVGVLSFARAPLKT